MKRENAVVIIPTFNELENIIPLVEEILTLPIRMNVIVVDDDSSDGTGRIAAERFAGNPAVRVFIRKDKRGRGFAGIFGYRKALEAGFDVIGEMDADFSHRPRFIPALVAGLDHADVSSGSRYLVGGRELRESFTRRMASRMARAYLHAVLGVRLTDPTSGFRFFRRAALESIAGRLRAGDPFIVTEVFYLLHLRGAKIVESPVVFHDRRKGRSKLRFSILVKYLFRTLLLRLRSANGR